MGRKKARQGSRALRAHWRGVVYRNFPLLHPTVQDEVLAVLGLDRFDDLGLMRTSSRRARQAASLVDIWNSTRQAPSVGHLEAEAQRLQPLYGSELTAVLAASDVLEDLRAVVTLLRQRKNGRAPRPAAKATRGTRVNPWPDRVTLVSDLAEEAKEEERQRLRQKVRARREEVRREEADEILELEQILQPEPPVEVKEEPAVEIVAAVPIEVEALMVEEVPATVAAVAEDPNVVEARKRVERLRQTAAWNRLIPDQQCEVGALLVTDAVAAAERLADYIAAAVERPKPSVGGAPAPEAANTCARRGCSSPVWDEKGPFKDAHGVGERDDQIRWAHGKFFCYRCRGELIARVKNLLAQRAQAAPPLERPPEPLVAMAAAEERAVEVQPAVATATA